MADTKITGLAATSGLVVADLIAVVDDVPGTPVTQKATLTQLITLLETATSELLKANVTDQLTSAFTGAIDDDGTITTTYTPTFAAGSNYKKIVNNSAFTLNAPTFASGEAGTLSLLIVNTTGAGAITWSGFVAGSPTGDTPSIVATDEFMVRIEGYNVSGTTYATADVVKLQA